MTDGVNSVLSGIDMSIQAIRMEHKTNVGAGLAREEGVSVDINAA